MLFHEPAFVYLFLPACLAVFLLLNRYASVRVAMTSLGLFSILFYSWWKPAYTPLLVGSVVINYAFGRLLMAGPRLGRSLLAVSIGANLTVLGMFKYWGFIAETVAGMTGWSVPVVHFELPLGISFFTFLQIAYLVDCWGGRAKDASFGRYFLFVTFFPHLIAGPLVHHSELMPQFKKRLENFSEHLSVGTVIFAIGLFKKLILAEQMGAWSDGFFASAAGGVPGLVDSWLAALCFTFQIYFDFSAYSDMAVGLSRMFGIWLPVNFNSPYKATNIIDFWRRWHMTLSRFFRDYLYFPLGGNRKGSARRYTNLMIVMLLAGLWHGAAWKFVLWGGLHGLYLMINHGWRKLTAIERFRWLRLPPFAGLVLTFAATVVAWVPFRASDLGETWAVLSGMFGLNGITLPVHYLPMLGGFGERLQAVGVEFGVIPGYGGGMQLAWLAGMLVFVWVFPNTQELLGAHRPALGFDPDRQTGFGGWSRYLMWRPDPRLAAVLGVAVAFLCLKVLQGRPGEFIYFQF